MRQLACLCLLAACSDDSLSRVYPDLRLCASESDELCVQPLDLGAFRTGETHDAAVIARNDGKGILDVQSLEVLSGAAASGTLPGRIGPASYGRVGVLVTPADGPNEARVAVSTNDPDTPRVEVDVRFTGVRPLLVICPGQDVVSTPPDCAADLAVDFGELRAGEVRDIVVLVRNTGTAPMDLAGAEVDDQSTVFGELSVLTSTGPGGLAAGAESPMVVRYQPRDGLDDTLYVGLLPVGESLPAATLTVTGSAPPNEAPVAVAVEYDTRATVFVAEVGQTIWLDGTGSADPEGDPLQYRWSIAGAPAGALAQPGPVTGSLTRIIPDRFGGWAVQLQVSDSLSVPGYADVTLDVQPRHFLSVVATWSDAGDVDLHVVPEGDALFGATDCFFLQPEVDWGVAGDTRDDGVLIRDVESGSGSETVNVRRPAAGRYDVWVNYFDSDGDRPASVTVDVRRDDASSSLRSATATLNATCETWKVGTLDWPAGTVTLSVDPHDQRCYGGP